MKSWYQFIILNILGALDGKQRTKLLRSQG